MLCPKLDGRFRLLLYHFAWISLGTKLVSSNLCDRLEWGRLPWGEMAFEEKFELGGVAMCLFYRNVLRLYHS